MYGRDFQASHGLAFTWLLLREGVDSQVWWWRIHILLVGTAVTGTNRLSIYPFTGVLLAFSSFLYFFMDFLNFIFFIFYFFFFVLFCLFLIYLLISFFFNWWKDLLFLTFMTNVINKIHKDKWSERMKQFYSNTFRRITPSSVGRLIELNLE